MAEQYIVAAFIDADLVVSAAGPFRSRERAKAACDRINEAGDWSVESEGYTITAQVVRLSHVADLIEQAGGDRG
ncbi:MAG: hypothetical protein FWF90_11480 [Promicromonosporaceae bacterium]|nr:hypothetical protein [Promicromonosporaceae bacterium]